MGMILVTKRENFANAIVPGACFALISGEGTVTAACDQSDGDLSKDPGVVGLQAPAGSYLLRETAPPTGYQAGADVQVTIAAGTPAAIDVINHLIKTTDTLVINKSDPQGTPAGGACFDIYSGDQMVGSICDGDQSDAEPNPGAMRIEVNAGDYLLRETPPAGFAPTEVAVSVVRGTETSIQVINQLLPTPTVEVIRGVLVATITGPDGASPFAGVCLVLSGPAAYNICDNGEGDVEPTAGTIEIDDMIAGDYDLVTIPPEGFVDASGVTRVTVGAAPVAQIMLTIQPIQTPTVEHTIEPTLEPTVTVPGVVIVNSVLDDLVTPLGGVCLALTGPETLNACDNGDGDVDPTEGAIELDFVPAGDYTVQVIPAAGFELVSDAGPLRVDAGQVATLSLVFRPVATVEPAATEPATGIVFAQSFLEDGVSPFGPFCLTLAGVTTITVCDNAEGDVDPTDATIEIDGVPTGEYAVAVSGIEGYELALEVPVLNVNAGEVATLTLFLRPIPAVEPTATQPATGIVFAQSFLEDGVTPFGPFCITLSGETTINVCDNGDGDVDPTDAVIEIDGVPTGDYAVAVTGVEGYELASEVPGLRVDAGQVAPLSFTFRPIPTVEPEATQPATGIVVLQSVLDDGVTPLGGVCVTLTGTSTVSVCDNAENDTEPTEGTIEVAGVPTGEFGLQIIVPAGYEIASEIPATVQVDANAPVSLAIAFRPVPSTGLLQISIVDAADGVTLLAGACFDINGADGTRSVCDNDENDRDELAGAEGAAGLIVVAELPPGDYAVHESQSPEAYTPAADQSIHIDAGQIAGLTFVNTASAPPALGSLQVAIVDDGGNLVPGACLSLIAQFGEGNPAPIDLCDTADSDGSPDGAVVFDALPPGIYVLSIAAPAQDYVAGEPVQVEIPAEGGAINATIVQRPAAGSLAITTLGPDGASAAGACYTLFAPDGSAPNLCDDDGDGVTLFDPLAPGDYTAQLSSTPAEFTAGDVTEQTVSVVAGQQSALTFPATPATASLVISVSDESGQPLPGACFDLNGPVTARACDDVENDSDTNSGSILVVGLPPGDYSVAQSQAPEGHGSAEPRSIALVAGEVPGTLEIVNPVEPAGIPSSNPVVYTDDAGRLWLLRPGDTQPARLDSDDLPFDQSMPPVFSSDHVELAFLVIDPVNPGANMRWVNIQDLTPGSVDFSSIGTPRQLAWVAGSHDTLIVAVEQLSGVSNVFFYKTDTSELSAPLFPGGSEPERIDAIHVAPRGTLVAIETTRTGGSADTWVFDTLDQVNPGLVNTGPNGGNDQDAFAGWSPGGDALLVRSGAEVPLYYVTRRDGSSVPLSPNPVFTGDQTIGTAPAWSNDGSLISMFDNDPGAGGQLLIVRADGSPLCNPIPGVQSAVWSRTEPRLWTIMIPPDSPQSLVTIAGDCSMQLLTSFEIQATKLNWDPTGNSLAIAGTRDGNATLLILAGGAITEIDMARSNLAFADVLSWSPNGEVLAIYAGGPSVSVWVVVPGTDSPVAIAGSTAPEGATYITRVWWP